MVGVVTKEDFPLGVVTKRDILRRPVSKGFDIHRVKAAETAPSPLITIEPKAPVGEALSLMALKAIRRIYITEQGRIG